MFTAGSWRTFSRIYYSSRSDRSEISRHLSRRRPPADPFLSSVSEQSALVFRLQERRRRGPASRKRSQGRPGWGEGGWERWAGRAGTSARFLPSCCNRARRWWLISVSRNKGPQIPEERPPPTV